MYQFFVYCFEGSLSLSFRKRIPACNSLSRYKFGIRTLLILTSLSALAAWDLYRQESNERAIARFEAVFPGSFLVLENPTGLRRFQSTFAQWMGLSLTNRKLKTIEVYPKDPSQLQELSRQQIQLLRDLPPAQHVLLNNFQFSLRDVTIRLRSDSDNSLYLGGCRLNQSELADLNLPSLRGLNLNSCQDICGLESIGTSFPQLRNLTLEFLNPLKDLAESLRECRQLESLHLAGPSVSSRTLDGVTNLHSLRTLSIWDSPIADSAFRDIDKLHQLCEVQLRNTRISNATLAYLSKLPNLKKLTLSDNPSLTDESISRLNGMKLEVLRIDGFPDMPGITDASADVFGSLSHLNELWLHGTHVGRRTVQQIARHRKLQNLILNCDQFQVDDLMPLASTLNLKILIKNRERTGHLEAGMTLTSNELQLLAGLKVSQDSSMELCWLHGLKGRHLKSLSNNINHVCLKGCQLAPDAMEELSERVEIRRLDLSETNVDSVMLAPIVKLQKLEHLDLSGCSKIDDRVILLVRQLPALVRLDRGNTGIGVDVSKQIQQQLNATARESNR